MIVRAVKSHIIYWINTLFMAAVLLGAYAYTHKEVVPALTDADIHKKGQLSTYTVYNAHGVGTGFTIDWGNRYIMTNRHMVQGYRDGKKVEFKTVRVQASHSKIKHRADVVFVSKKYDMAVLQVQQQVYSLGQMTLSMKEPRVTDTTYVYGSPAGIRNVFTKGQVIGFEGGDIMINNTARPGNSGSAVMNSDGHVIGILYAGFRTGDSFAFIVPIKHIIEEFCIPQGACKIVKGE